MNSDVYGTWNMRANECKWTQIKIPPSNFNLQIVQEKYITRVFECKIPVMLYEAVRYVHTGGGRSSLAFGPTERQECRAADDRIRWNFMEIY